jgi:hypothetical protein
MGGMVPLGENCMQSSGETWNVFWSIVGAMPGDVKTGQTERDVSLAFFPETY